jgi:hypothetical protein
MVIPLRLILLLAWTIASISHVAAFKGDPRFQSAQMVHYLTFTRPSVIQLTRICTNTQRWGDVEFQTFTEATLVHDILKNKDLKDQWMEFRALDGIAQPSDFLSSGESQLRHRMEIFRHNMQRLQKAKIQNPYAKFGVGRYSHLTDGTR